MALIVDASGLYAHADADEPSHAAVATALNLSEKTLQRRLQDENTSYQQMLDEVRRDLAQHYLREGPMSVCEVTFRLGFSDQSSFTRAFRRWTGVTPPSGKASRRLRFSIIRKRLHRKADAVTGRQPVLPAASPCHAWNMILYC